MNIEKMRSDLGLQPDPTSGNFYVDNVINRLGEKIALDFSDIDSTAYNEVSFERFRGESLAYASGLKSIGVKADTRVLILLPVSPELFFLIYATFHLGAIPVFIDTTMERKKIIAGIADSNAKYLISIDSLLKFKLLLPKLWFIKTYSLDKKRLGTKLLKSLKDNSFDHPTRENRDMSKTALISFSSGSTGRPKGVNRTIEILLNQKVVSEYLWKNTAHDVDLTCFPMIVLQNLSCGMKTIIPRLNYSNFLETSISDLWSQIIKHQVSRLSAQPYLMEKICDYILENPTSHHLNSIVVGGACVSLELCRKIKKTFPETKSYIVYGSSEAEPMAFTPVEDFLNSSGFGLLLGKPIPCLEVRIDALDVSSMSECYFEFGEILIAGPHVVKEYIDNHPMNKVLKVKENDITWHRTGDIGYFDDHGRLWLLGRVSDRIQREGKLIPCYGFEEELIRLDGVVKAGFVGCKLYLEVDQQFNEPVIKSYLALHRLSDFEIVIMKKIPVDKRHFSRIDRSALSAMP